MVNIIVNIMCHSFCSITVTINSNWTMSFWSEGKGEKDSGWFSFLGGGGSDAKPLAVHSWGEIEDTEKKEDKVCGNDLPLIPRDRGNFKLISFLSTKQILLIFVYFPLFSSINIFDPNITSRLPGVQRHVLWPQPQATGRRPHRPRLPGPMRSQRRLQILHMDSRGKEEMLLKGRGGLSGQETRR